VLQMINIYAMNLPDAVTLDRGYDIGGSSPIGRMSCCCEQ